MLNAKKVHELREAADITQLDFANDIGLSQTQLSFLERGLKQPTAIILKRMADRLHVTMDELMEANN